MQKQRLMLCFVALLATACSDSKSKPKSDDDAGTSMPETDGGQGGEGDSGKTPPASRLPRPALERPPTNGLPADLRPPR